MVPELFHAELRRGFELITNHPEVGPPAQDVELAGVRRLHLSRIRYYLYYHPMDDTVEVIGLWHTSRGGPPAL
jgi:plasmid stabilization system protein ParE